MNAVGECNIIILELNIDDLFDGFFPQSLVPSPSKKEVVRTLINEQAADHGYCVAGVLFEFVAKLLVVIVKFDINRCIGLSEVIPPVRLYSFSQISKLCLPRKYLVCLRGLFMFLTPLFFILSSLSALPKFHRRMYNLQEVEDRPL
jgi:hypothetical protein